MIPWTTTATTMDERIKFTKEADTYFGEQHWILQLGGGEVARCPFAVKAWVWEAVSHTEF
jgi:hypothetical protein